MAEGQTESYLLPFEVWQHIFEFLDLPDQLKLKQLSTQFNHLRIHYIPSKYQRKLTNRILRRRKNFKYLRELNACNNSKITDVNHMTNLEFLDASCNNGDLGIC